VNHSYIFFKTARKNVPRCVRVPVRLEPTCRARVFTNPQWLVRLDAARRALFRRVPRIDFDEVRSFAFAYLYSSICWNVPHAAPVRFREFPGIRSTPFASRSSTATRSYSGGVVVRDFVKEVTTLSLEIMRGARPRLVVVSPNSRNRVPSAKGHAVPVLTARGRQISRAIRRRCRLCRERTSGCQRQSRYIDLG